MKRSKWNYAGLKNLACICYMNSMNQLFFNTTAFTNAILMANDGVP